MDRNVIETAFVSGRLGQAIYRVEEQLYAVTLDGDPRPASSADFQEIFSPGAEYELVLQQTADGVQAALQMFVRQYNALFLVLNLLDSDVSLSTRIVAAQAAEKLLTAVEEREFVSRRLLSVPLPVQVRSHRHQMVSPWAEFTHVRSLLSEVFESQPVLDELWAGWRRAIESQGIDETKRPSLEATLVSSGFFANVTRAISARDHQRFNFVVVEHATDSEVLGEIKTAQSLLTAFRSEVYSKFFVDMPRAVQKPLKLKKGGRPSRPPEPTEGTDTITQLIYGLDTATERPRRYVVALEAKARVDKQISAIRELLFAGKIPTADKYLEDLLAFQLGQGDREHAAMSLCALTTIALDANQFDVADRLSQYALRLTSDDKVVYTSRAEVFKQRGHFDAALKAYQEVIERFGQDRWALNGYADVLKDKGLFDESIKRYKETQEGFPDNPVAFNGEISVLKAKGERRRALSIAVRYAKRFEYDSVTRATLAGCLASVGKYEEALRHYTVAMKLNWPEPRTHIGYLHALTASGALESALRHADVFIAKFPKALPVLNIKAILLRNAGRLDEAEAIYQNLIEHYPTYVPATIGIAAIRVLQNKIEEAQRTLREENMESELDWFGFRLRALSYASAGDYQRAAPRLTFGLGHCPWLHERPKLETALGFVELQRGEVARSIGLLNKNLDQLGARHQQVRLTFLAHAHAQRGATDVASILLGRLFTSKESGLRSVREAIVSEYKLPVAMPRDWNTDYSHIKAQELGLAVGA
jgi:tetratricopeptide (TPR) repeat protein